MAAGAATARRSRARHAERAAQPRRPRARSRARPRPARRCCSTSAGAAGRSASSAPRAGEAAQPLLSGAYYLDAPWRPSARCGAAPVAQLLQGRDRRAGAARRRATPARGEPCGAGQMDGRRRRWCCASPARTSRRSRDDLLPVTLRRGGRTLGGALSWEQPAQLAPFAATAPSPASQIPADVTVARQVLAEPALDLAGKTWARLDRRHAAGHRREARQGLARAGPHHGRSRMVEPADLRPLRQHAAAHRRVSQGVAAAADGAAAAGRDARRLRPAAAARRRRPQPIAAGAFATAVAPARAIRPASTAPPTRAAPSTWRRRRQDACAADRRAAAGRSARETYRARREVDFRPWLLGGGAWRSRWSIS